MKAPGWLTVVATCVSMTACAYGINVDRNEARATCDRYVTFFVLPGNSSGSMTIDRELKAEVETALADKGLVATSPEDAQAVVVVHTATAAKHSRDALYEGWGGWRWRLADTRIPNGTEDYKEGTVVVDVFDAWTKKLLWHGSASRNVVSRSAARIFRNVPFGGYPVADSESLMTSEQGTRIIFSSVPAVLIRIDGEPQYEQVSGTDLQRVINTTALVLRDVAGMHYFRYGDTWMEADDLTGTWSTAGTVPNTAQIALRQSLGDSRTDLFASEQTNGPMPVVYVSTTPAELIVTDGEPQFAAFNGTPLHYIRNTTSTVFREPTDQELYVRIPTGWFRAWTTKGPWEPVPEDKLPADLPSGRD